MNAYRLFTIESGSVRQGAVVEKLTLKGANLDIPAILIGEEGRGRQRGVLPVTLTASQQVEWQEKGRVTILFAETGTSQSGKPKLISRESETTDEKVLLVFRTKIGFRGGNSHTGDRTGEEEYDDFGTMRTRITFADFPGEKLVEGIIAEGDAGRMGSGQQMVALMPKGIWFRTGYSGRLYGAPPAHYYKWDGTALSAMTWDDRQTLEALMEDGAPLPVTPLSAPIAEETLKPFPKSKLTLIDDEDDDL